MRCHHALLAGLSLIGSGCFSHYSDGPRFAEIAAVRVPPDHGLVYVYREEAAWGAIHEFTASWNSRSLGLYSGAYGVFVVPEGKQTFHGRAASGDFTVDVVHDAPVFVRTEFNTLEDPQKSLIVPAAEAMREIRSLHLAPGGGARTPIPPPPDTRANTPEE